MSHVLVTESYISDIASAIRSKNGQSASYYPSQMAAAIGSIISAGALSVISKSINTNGIYNPASDNADAFSEVVVAVSNTYSASDEGKVVSSGFLVSQVSSSISANGYYDTTLNNNIVVNVPTGSGTGSGIDKAFIEGGISNITNDALSNIKSFAFTSDHQIKNVNLPNVVNIRESAFAWCDEIRDVYLPKCENIYKYAFAGCGLISSINIESVRNIGDSAFYSCRAISEINIPLCKVIGYNAFYFCTSLKSINAPICENISGGAFTSCALISASFPNCSYIGASAFISCRSLSYASFPNCSYISSSAFYNCASLTSVNVQNATTVGQCAFNYTSISEIRFDRKVEFLWGAFHNCRKLESVYLLYEELLSLTNSNIFSYTPIDASSYLGYFGSIFVPASLVDAYKTARNWSTISDRITAYVEE